MKRPWSSSSLSLLAIMAAIALAPAGSHGTEMPMPVMITDNNPQAAAAAAAAAAQNHNRRQDWNHPVPPTPSPQLLRGSAMTSSGSTSSSNDMSPQPASIPSSTVSDDSQYSSPHVEMLQRLYEQVQQVLQDMSFEQLDPNAHAVLQSSYNATVASTEAFLQTIQQVQQQQQQHDHPHAESSGPTTVTSTVDPQSMTNETDASATTTHPNHHHRIVSCLPVDFHVQIEVVDQGTMLGLVTCAGTQVRPHTVLLTGWHHPRRQTIPIPTNILWLGVGEFLVELDPKDDDDDDLLSQMRPLVLTVSLEKDPPEPIPTNDGEMEHIVATRSILLGL